MAERRLTSLDALRGIAVAGMILVSAPGSGEVSALLSHSEWHGCTPADLVFPFFLFTLGVSAALSLRRHLAQGATALATLKHALARAAGLFAFGLAGNGVPVHFHPGEWRVMGPLQRIALCYLGAAALYLGGSAVLEAVVAGALLLGYWALLGGDLGPATSLPARFDQWLLPGALGGGTYDSEGLLSTLPAFATTICGLLAGRLVSSEKRSWRTAAVLAAAGSILLLSGLAWDAELPMNKHLWTSSFGAFATGMALCLFAGLYWAIELNGAERPFAPLVAYGRNAFLVYVVSFLFLVAQDAIPSTLADGTPATLRRRLCEVLFEGWNPPERASWLYAAAYTSLWLPLFGWLYRRDIALKASWSGLRGRSTRRSGRRRPRVRTARTRLRRRPARPT